MQNTVHDPLNSLFLFGVLTFFHLWGGAAIGAGLRAGRLLPVCWGGLIGGAPLYFGIERAVQSGSWVALMWQLACLFGSVLAVGLAMPRVRAWFLQQGMRPIMVGTLIMATGALSGAILFQLGSEALSLVLGGVSFVFGAMWFSSGLRQLRGRGEVSSPSGK